MKNSIHTHLYFLTLTLGFLAIASCSSSSDMKGNRANRKTYVPTEQVNLDEWTYYKPITVFYQTDNGRSWDSYKHYRIYQKKMTKGYRYVVADLNNGQVYNFSECGNGKFQYTFNNGKESCWFNCKLDDVSRIVHITHQ